MSAWTDDRIDQLSRLWLQGLSAAAIARALGGGLTRNSVLSKVTRLGLSRGRPAKRATRPDPGQPGSEAPSDGAVTILSVRRDACRWPYGDPAGTDFRLCGRPAERGAFCAAHATLAYRPKPTSAEDLMHLAGLG